MRALLLAGKTSALSLLSAGVFAVSQVGLGHLVIHEFGLHDPWPREGAFASLLDSLRMAVPAYFGLYFLGLLMAWRDLKRLRLSLAAGQAAVLGLLFASFVTWYQIPSYELFWVFWFEPVVLIAGVFFSTWLLASAFRVQ